MARAHAGRDGCQAAGRWWRVAAAEAAELGARVRAPRAALGAFFESLGAARRALLVVGVHRREAMPAVPRLGAARLGSAPHSGQQKSLQVTLALPQFQHSGMSGSKPPEP